MRKAKDSTDTTVRKTESWKINNDEQLGKNTHKNIDVISTRSVTPNFNGSAEFHRLVTLSFHPSCNSHIKHDLHVMPSWTSKNLHYQQMSINTD
jgi:hypothetical protein